MSNQTKKSKFQFGETPDTFKRNVDVINIHGAESTIEFEFIYRTKLRIFRIDWEKIVVLYITFRNI